MKMFVCCGSCNRCLSADEYGSDEHSFCRNICTGEYYEDTKFLEASKPIIKSWKFKLLRWLRRD